MLVPIIDANNDEHTVVWQGQDQLSDASGALNAGAVANPQVFQVVLLANPLRSGFLFQNTSANAMLLNELGGGQVPGNSWIINSGEAFPPCGYPVPTGTIEVAGIPGRSVLGDTFTCREWVNAPGE